MSYCHDLTTMPLNRRGPFTSQVVSGEALMAIWVNVQAGTHTPAHSHPNEQITWLMEGRMEYRIGRGLPKIYEAGTVVLIPANIEHEVWYREDCRYFELFSPPRPDLFPPCSACAVQACVRTDGNLVRPGRQPTIHAIHGCAEKPTFSRNDTLH